MLDLTSSSCSRVTTDIKACCDACPIPMAIVADGELCHANTLYRDAFGPAVADRCRRAVLQDTRQPVTVHLTQGPPTPEQPRTDGGIDHFYAWTDAGTSHLGHIRYEPVPGDPRARLDRHFRWRTEEFAGLPGVALDWFQDVTDEVQDRATAKISRATGQGLIDGILRTKKRDPGHVPGVRYKIVQQEQEVGGDFFFARLLDDGKRILLFVGDSAGKGIKGAMTSAIFGTLLQQVVQRRIGLDGSNSPAKAIIEHLDDEFRKIVHRPRASEDPLDIGCDGCVCVFDLENKSLSCASGNFPLWYAHEDELERVGNFQSAPGKSIGFPRATAGREDEFPHENIKLHKGMVFFAASDGVFEARGKPPQGNPAGRRPEYGAEQFENRLRSLIKEIKPRKQPQRIVDGVYDDLRGFCGNEQHEDDVLIVAVDPFA